MTDITSRFTEQPLDIHCIISITDQRGQRWPHLGPFPGTLCLALLQLFWLSSISIQVLNRVIKMHCFILQLAIVSSATSPFLDSWIFLEMWSLPVKYDLKIPQSMLSLDCFAIYVYFLNISSHSIGVQTAPKSRCLVGMDFAIHFLASDIDFVLLSLNLSNNMLSVFTMSGYRLQN